MSEHVQNADTKNAAAEKSNVEVSVNDERAQRRARRQTLLDSGINPRTNTPLQAVCVPFVTRAK